MMGILDMIKIAIGYERKSHTYDSSKIAEGDIKILSKNEMLKNEDGMIIHCKRSDVKSKWKCHNLPYKPR